jgi:uncharacterized pyridoxamine 5'-phosphate oxidase family protein
MPLTSQEIKELLSKPILAHLAVTKGGKPRVSPIWVHYDDGLFYFTTRGGRVKGEAIRKDPDIALSIATDSPPYKAILVEGRAYPIEVNKWEIIGKIVAKYVSAPFGKKEGDKLLQEWHSEPDRMACVIRPSRVLTWNYGRGDLKLQDDGVSMSTKL